MRSDMPIHSRLDDIPIGAENAITRKNLAALWNVNDREARRIVADLRTIDDGTDYVIVSVSRDSGYYRTQNVTEINHFVNETSKPSPALTALKPDKSAAAETFQPGDQVKHVTFGVGTILSSKPMGGDILYEIAFEKVGTKKLMATYARLTKV